MINTDETRFAPTVSFSISVNSISINICEISTVFLIRNVIWKIVLYHEFSLFSLITFQFRKPFDHILALFFHSHEKINFICHGNDTLQACTKISSKSASSLLFREKISSGECREIIIIFTYSAYRQRADATTVSWGLYDHFSSLVVQYLKEGRWMRNGALLLCNRADTCPTPQNLYL